MSEFFDDMDFGQFHRGPMPFPPMDLMSVLFEDMRSHENGEVAPDTAGADFFFIQYFMTDDMYWDFDRIEEDFMKHCYDKLREFANVQYYEHTATRYSEPDNSHRIMVMGLILNGAKSGDEYCKGLIRYLFKTYHKPLYKQLKSQFAAANSAKKETEQLLNKFENDRNELIALREFAYRLEQEVPEIQQTSVDEMKAAIADKAYVIIGGHVNWVNKLKSEFPNWTFILPSAYKTVDAGGLDNKDMIFFFTDHISHVAYGKFVAIARERKIPFSYLHGVNMEQIIRQIYESGK